MITTISQDRILDHLKAHPGASFDDLHAVACFDGVYNNHYTRGMIESLVVNGLIRWGHLETPDQDCYWLVIGK